MVTRMTLPNHAGEGKSSDAKMKMAVFLEGEHLLVISYAELFILCGTALFLGIYTVILFTVFLSESFRLVIQACIN